MRPRWRKVISDLIDNKARTILVVFSIAVGVFAIGVIAGAYVIISEDLGVTYAANNPSNIEIRMADFDQDMLSTVRNFEGIKDVEARRVFNLRLRLFCRCKTFFQAMQCCFAFAWTTTNSDYFHFLLQSDSGFDLVHRLSLTLLC